MKNIDIGRNFSTGKKLNRKREFGWKNIFSKIISGFSKIATFCKNNPRKIGLFTIVSIMFGIGFSFFISQTKGASFGWLQIDWSGGADTNATANHTTNQTGWTKFFSKDANVDVTTTPGEAKLVAVSDIWEQTTDADFNAGMLSNTTVLDNSVRLPIPEGGACTVTNECIVGSYCIGNVCTAPVSFVTIGEQVWMANNVNIGTMVTGATTQTDNSVIEKYCYGDVSANCDTDGGLYQWDEMMQYTASCNGTGAPPDDICATPVQGICPSGTHIPSHYEWTTLEKNVGSNPNAFPYDTTTTGWLGTDEGTNLKSGGSSGFGGVLAGARVPDGSFLYRGAYAYFWTSTEGGAGAWHRYLGSRYAAVNRLTNDKAHGFSVRCLKD